MRYSVDRDEPAVVLRRICLARNLTNGRPVFNDTGRVVDSVHAMNYDRFNRRPAD